MLLKYYFFLNILVFVAARIKLPSELMRYVLSRKNLDKGEINKERLYNEVVNNISRVNSIIEDLIENYERLKKLYHSQEELSDDYSSDAEIDEAFQQQQRARDSRTVKLPITTKNPFNPATEMFFFEENPNYEDDDDDNIENDTNEKTNNDTTTYQPDTIKIATGNENEKTTKKERIQKLDNDYLNQDDRQYLLEFYESPKFGNQEQGKKEIQTTIQKNISLLNQEDTTENIENKNIENFVYQKLIKETTHTTKQKNIFTAKKEKVKAKIKEINIENYDVSEQSTGTIHTTKKKSTFPKNKENAIKKIKEEVDDREPESRESDKEIKHNNNQKNDIPERFVKSTRAYMETAEIDKVESQELYKKILRMQEEKNEFDKKKEEVIKQIIGLLKNKKEQKAEMVEDDDGSKELEKEKTHTLIENKLPEERETDIELNTESLKKNYNKTEVSTVTKAVSYWEVELPTSIAPSRIVKQRVQVEKFSENNIWNEVIKRPVNLQTENEVIYTQPRTFFRDQYEEEDTPKCCGAGVEYILLDKTADIQTTPRIVFESAKQSQESIEDEQTIIKEQLQTRILRKAYGDACLKVVVRKCWKACKAAYNDSCKKYTCNVNFREVFRKNAKSNCIHEFRGALRSGGELVQSNFQDITQNGYLAAACLPTPKKKSSLRSNASIKELGPFGQLNILRDRFEKACQKASTEKCTNACVDAMTKTCEEVECKGHKKDFFKKQCKRDCKKSYKGKSLSKDKESGSDSGSGSESGSSGCGRGRGGKCKNKKKRNRNKHRSKETDSSGSSESSSRSGSSSESSDLNIKATNKKHTELSSFNSKEKHKKSKEEKEKNATKEDKVASKEERIASKEENENMAKEDEKAETKLKRQRNNKENKKQLRQNTADKANVTTESPNPTNVVTTSKANDNKTSSDLNKYDVYNNKTTL